MRQIIIANVLEFVLLLEFVYVEERNENHLGIGCEVGL